MRILILGGTNFIGPHLVRAARSAGHQVTLFNRGKTAPDAFSELEQLRGDRKSGDYTSLADSSWDVVIDTCAYWPRAIHEAVAALAGRVDHYVLISTVSVYAEFDEAGYDEESPLATTDEPDAEEVTPKNYGALKVLCEQTVDEFDGPVTIVRPGLVVGPGDATDRFTYWPVTVARGGDVLAPGTPADPVQWIDVRDLAAFVLLLAQNGTSGVFNAVTPARQHSMGELLEACVDAVDEDVELTWVAADFLHEHEVRAWNDLPAWVPPGTPLGGIPHCSAERAVAAGLQYTPLAETVADTLAWYQSERGDALKTGLTRERMDALLETFTDTTS